MVQTLRNPFSARSRRHHRGSHICRVLLFRLKHIVNLVNPLNVGLFLVFLGMYLHTFVAPPVLPRPSSGQQEGAHIVVTRPNLGKSWSNSRVVSEPVLSDKNLEFVSTDDSKDDQTEDNSDVDKKELHPLLIQSEQDIATRQLRFPSIDDRVKLYMSNWYSPPCKENNDGLIRYRKFGSGIWLIREQEQAGNEQASPPLYLNASQSVGMARLLSMDRETILGCVDNDYCVDAIEFWVPSLDRVVRTEGHYNVPVLAQFGDSDTAKAYVWNRPERHPDDLRGFPNVPYIMKFRFRFQDDTAVSKMTSSCVPGRRPIFPTVDVPSAAGGAFYQQPIVWRLTSLRHYGMLPQIPSVDIPWNEKKDVAVWRGALTGIYRDGFKMGMLKHKPPEEICLMMHRCKLAYQTKRSSLVDAMLVGKEKWVPRTVKGTPVYGDKLSYGDMLQYKGIIMLEGNDISSGFKWALYSNSVVLTQPPTKTSWAMEELLEPWVHYVPLNEDLSDVAEKMQWILDHDHDAQRISHRGSLWVQDLLFHPDSEEDDRKIYDEMLVRYKAHFVEDAAMEATDGIP